MNEPTGRRQTEERHRAQLSGSLADCDQDRAGDGGGDPDLVQRGPDEDHEKTFYAELDAVDLYHSRPTPAPAGPPADLSTGRPAG